MKARYTTERHLTLTVKKVANLSTTPVGPRNGNLSNTTVFTTLI
ncbi:hypothetical protein [Spirosoma sp. KNUC1025]